MPRDQRYRRYKMDKDSQRFNEDLNLHCGLDLEQKKVLQKMPQLVMMSNPTKSGSKKISSSVDMVETVTSDYMSP